MENFNLSFPIDLIKKEERIVCGIATADNIDKSGDLVDFQGSLDAFKNWGGNIREMHAPIAVGKAINYEPVEITGEDGKKYNAIKVSAYISKGAQSTWEKVLDGTLKAFSIGGKVIEKVESTEKIFRGRPVNIIKQYSLGELSLVDNPANALAVVDIIKMNDNGDLDYILDLVNEIDFEKAERLKDPKGGLTAAGRRHFKQTEGANLKPGVKGPADTPEKMRRKGSFLTRFFTNPSGPMKDEKGRPTRLALSAAAWGEPVPQNAQDAAELAAKGRRLLERYQNTKEKSIDTDIEKEGEVTTGNMDAGIKNPTQGYPKKKKKKEMVMANKIKKSSPLTEALNEALSNATVLYFSAHRAHWNVEGTDFREYHGLFEDIYSDTYGSIDTFAENVRKLGDFPIALSEAEDMAAYEDDSATTDAKELAMNLYEKNQSFIALLKNTFNIANNSNEQGIANFIAERIDMHEKWDWQLRASLGISTGTPEIDDSEEEDSMDTEEEDGMMEMLNELVEMFKSAPTKMENGESFPASAYAYVPDPSKPSTWKIRLWETNDSKETAAQVGRAIAAIGAGFRGNKAEIPSEDMASVKRKVMAAWKSTHKDAKPEDVPSVLKTISSDEIDLTKMQEESLQNDVNYDKVLNMNEQEINRLSLLKRVVNWLVPDVQENASTKVEVTENTQEEDMDIEVLKDALSAVVDDKLANFANSIKEEVEASLNEKIDNITKGFEASTVLLQEKLEATEKALAETEEQVGKFAEAGAIKKSVDPEDDDEEGETIVKSESVWNNVYLPQSVISALGYKS